MTHVYYIENCGVVKGPCVLEITMSLSEIVMVGTSVVGGLLLIIYLFFSDGPVFAVDTSLVESQENRDD